jgi:hypothetical protein
VSSWTEVSKLPGPRPVSVAAAALARQREQVPAAQPERLEEQRAVLAQAQPYPPAQRPPSRSMARPSK